MQWGTILRASPNLGLLVFISLLSLVLTNGSIELAVEKDLDLNRELKAVGLANLVAGLGSTMVGNQALPSTLLVHRLGAANRLTGVFKAVPCFMVLLLGPTFLNYFPKPILGSLLLFLGINLLWQWLYDAWFRLPLVDYLTILVMLVGINTTGFIPGIGIGVGMATAQFLVQCSRLETTSRVELAANPAMTELPEKPAPESQGDWLNRVDCVSLQGLLFFGTAKAMCQQLSDRILHPTPEGTPQPYLILDFAAVLTMDSSAAMGLSKLAKLAQKHDCTLVFCQLSDRFKDQLLKTQALDLTVNHLCTDRAAALQWCHEQLTFEATATPSQPATDELAAASHPSLETISLELTELSP